MFALVLLLTLVALACAYWYNRWKSLPPGPFPFPLIGNMPQFGTLVAKHGGIAEAMRELRKQYGPVFTLWLGPIPSVHICSMELAQETMHKRGGEFVDRWVPYLWSIVNDNKGIFNASGEHWQEQRRFMLHAFRNFGLGRGIMEERIMMELELRVKDLEALMANDTVTFDPTEFFELLVGSIINRILSGERFDKDNEKQFFHLKHRMDEFTADFSLVDFFSDYRILWKVPYFRNRWNKMIEVMKDLEAFLLAQIRERVRDVNSGDRVIGENPEDYMDAFIQKIVEERGVEGSGYTEESLAYNLMDLWSAGQETTTITLRSGFLQLIEQPQILAKAREELRTVTENSRTLSLQDRKSTPYFNAVLTEMQRISNLLQVNVFRQAKGDTQIGSYTVPDGTPLAAEISVLMIDDEHFDHSDQFDPSRFIKNPDLEKHVLPFGIGKRACPGESLARAELYLLAGNLILRYDFQKKKGATKVDSVNCEGFFKTPPRYEMTVTKL